MSPIPKFLVHQGPLAGLRPTFEGIGESIRRYGQMRGLLQASGVTLFTEPALSADGMAVSWYTPLSGPWRPYTQLGEEEQRLARGDFHAQLRQLRAALAPLSEGDRLNFERTLRWALEVPRLDRLLYANGRVLLIEWGFVSDAVNAERGLLARLPEGDVPTPPPPPPPPPEKARLHVQVIDRTRDGAPGAGVELEIRQGRFSGERYRAVADEQGLARFDDLPRGLGGHLRCRQGAHEIRMHDAAIRITEPEQHLTLYLVARRHAFWKWLGWLLALLALLLGAWLLRGCADGGAKPPAVDTAPAAGTARIQVLDARSRAPITAGRFIGNDGATVEVRDGVLVLGGAARSFAGRIVVDGYADAPFADYACCAPHEPVLMQPAPPPAASVFNVSVVDELTRRPVAAGTLTWIGPDLVEHRVNVRDGKAQVPARGIAAGQALKIRVAAEGYQQWAGDRPCCADQTIALKPAQGDAHAGQLGDYTITLTWNTDDDLDLYLAPSPARTLPCTDSRNGRTLQIRKLDFDHARTPLVCKYENDRYSMMLDIDAKWPDSSGPPLEHIYLNKTGSGTQNFAIAVYFHHKRSAQPTTAYTVTVEDSQHRVLRKFEGRLAVKELGTPVEIRF